ncbi:hypothetical protein R4K52_11085, partial [Brachyspira pilosicoli]|uniref:hypothetical protein n=1 Tax=Brachyspira pilosicoli TaxID=52584 RepID=UPI003003AD9C
ATLRARFAGGKALQITEIKESKIFNIIKNIILYQFVVVLFPAARCADFVKRTKKCKCFSFVCLKLY